MHQDHVVETPHGFQVLASTSKRANQVMKKGGQYLTIQGHPEFDGGFVRELIIMRNQKGIFSNDFAAECLASVDLHLDTNLFADKILQFIRESAVLL